MRMASTDRLESPALDRVWDARLECTLPSPELLPSLNGLRLTLESKLKLKIHR